MPSSKPFPCSPALFASLGPKIIAGGGSIAYASVDNLHGSFRPPKHPEVNVGFAFNDVDTLVLTILDEAWYETAQEVWDGIAPYLQPATGS